MINFRLFTILALGFLEFFALPETSYAQMNLPPMVRVRFYDNNGDPLSGGKVYTYQAGTTTNQATYTAQDGLTANANPIILDANGEADMWLDPSLSYKFRIDDSDDVTLKTVDNVVGLLANDAVPTAALQDNSVTEPKIGEDAVDATGLYDDAVDGNRAVTSDHIRNQAITPIKVASTSMVPGQTINCALAAATTSESNDSIEVTGSGGTALSSTNVCYAKVNDTVVSLTADVVLDLTGAHWGEGTDGDLTDYLLSVYICNDSSTGKVGVGSISNHKVILNADDTATASSVTSIEKIYVNSALTADSECVELGWFKANFDDTGGASEDLWVVQTGTGDINLGARPAIVQYWTPTSSWSTNVTHAGYWYRDGENLVIEATVTCTGAPTSAVLTIDLPSGLVTDTAKISENWRGQTQTRDSGTRTHTASGVDVKASTTNVGALVNQADLQYTFFSSVSSTASRPMTFASGDTVTVLVSIPIVGWD